MGTSGSSGPDIPKDRRIKMNIRGLVLGCCLPALVAGGVAAQGKKFSATGKAGPVLSLTKMSPGDDPKHEVSLIRRLDKDVCSDADFGALDVDTLNVSDYKQGNGTQKGYRTFTHASGDKIFSAYEGETGAERTPEGKTEYIFKGKWWYTGGTGKFQGITGSGTYKGRLGADGVTYEWEGSYEVAKSAGTGGKP